MKSALLLLLLLLSLPAMANDVFGFLLPQCKIVEGIPVSYQDEILTVIGPEGKITELRVEEINGIAHYVLQKSPYDFSDLSDEAIKFAKKFEIKGSDIVLNGFPYQFIDGTIFIIDHRGARRVFGREEIGRVGRSSRDTIFKGQKGSKLPPLNLPEGISECQKKSGGLMPVRFLADKIQILEIVNEWEKGFRELNDLAERSMFYPRPYLFDEHDRFGFLFFDYAAPAPNLIPVRYSFTNGEDFRFQGETGIGGDFDQIGPRALPMNMARTQLKFHFLQASFEGNLNGMGMGSSVYTDEDELVENAEKNPDDVYGDVSFNHLTLIGFDWHHWGLSFGPIFPVFYVQTGAESRESTPRKSLPLVRLTWTNDKFKLKLSGSNGSIHAKTDMNKKSEIIVGAAEEDHVDNYKIDFFFLRPGIEYDGIEDMKLSMDLIYMDWKYKDSVEGEKMDFSSQQLSVLSSVRRDFTDYVSLGLYLLWNKPDEKGTFNNRTIKRTNTAFNLGGTFEFLF